MAASSQRNRKALVTLACGEFYTELGKVTHPFMEDYARKCAAEFLVIRKRQVNKTYNLSERYEKFQVFDLLDDYEQILFVDTDILIAPDAPSLFEITPIDRFAAASEAGYSMAQRDITLTQEILGAVEWLNPYFNSGVMVFSRMHKEVFDPLSADLKSWSTGEFRAGQTNLLNDQPYLNHRLNKLRIPLQDLTYRYNHTRVIKETETRFSSFLIHYSGPSGHRYGTRVGQMRKDAALLRNSTFYWLSKKAPWYRWVADRMDMDFVRYLIEEKWKLKST